MSENIIDTNVDANINLAENNVVTENAGNVTSINNEYVRPEWLPEKFKTEQELANSYKELESKLGGTFGAPEEYKWSGDGNEPDGVKLFKQVAKEQNLSQQAFDNIINSYLDKEKAIVEIQQKQIDEIKKEIGDERITKVRNQLFGIGLNDEQIKAIGNFATGKVQFEALEVMMKKINNVVNTANINSSPAIDVEKEIQNIYNQPDYRYNAGKYQQKLTELYKMKAG